MAKDGSSLRATRLNVWTRAPNRRSACLKEHPMPASLRIVLTDAAGAGLNDNVTIDLFSQQNSNHYQVTKRIQRQIVIKPIDIAGGPVYRVMVTPANHRTIQFFTMLNES